MWSSRVDENYTLIRKKLSLGSGNLQEGKKEVSELIKFTRHLHNTILTDKNFTRELLFNTDFQLDELIMIESIIVSIFTEAYQCGNCGEQSRISLIEFLKSGFNKSIDIINIEGIDINGNLATHALLALDLDKKANIDDLKTWKNVTLFDTWGLYKPMHFTNDSTPTASDLTSGLIPIITKIISTFRIDKNLTSTQCGSIILLLNNFAKTYTLDRFTQDAVACPSKRTDFNAKMEFARIQEVVIENIAVFKKLSLQQPFIIKHYENSKPYNPLLFNVTRKTRKLIPTNKKGEFIDIQHSMLNG